MDADVSFMGKEAGHGPLVSTAGFGSGLCGVVMSGASGGDDGHRPHMPVHGHACLSFGRLFWWSPGSPA